MRVALPGAAPKPRAPQAAQAASRSALSRKASGAPAGGSSMAASALPKLIAFDLDATLWYPEMYMISGPPFKLGACARGRPVVVDRAGEEVGLIGDAWRILHELASHDRWEGVQIAYVSRTDEPRWANQCLQMLKLDSGLSLHSLAHHHEIYPGSKRTHFRRIHERTGIAFEDMLFWDDMKWNTEDTSRLGVVSIYAPDGLTGSAWEKGLAEFARRGGANGRA